MIFSLSRDGDLTPLDSGRGVVAAAHLQSQALCETSRLRWPQRACGRGEGTKRHETWRFGLEIYSERSNLMGIVGF